ncbi:MAG: CPBP family intramembrane glutamic endopeptidase [Solitalea sp.]
MNSFLSYLQPFLRVFAFFGCYIFLTGFSAAMLVPFLSGIDFSQTDPSALASMQSDPALLLLMQLASLIGFLFTLFVFSKLPPRKDYIQFGLIDHRVIKDLGLGTAIGTGVILLSFLILWLSGTVGNLQLNGDMSLRLLVVWFGIYLIVAFVEEVMFRGYFLNVFMDRYTPLTSVLITSILFGSMHFLNPSFGWLGLVNITLAGVLIGLTYFIRKTIWLPLGIHFGWNFVQGTVLGFHVSGLEADAVFRHELSDNALLSGGAFGLEGSLVTTLVCLIVIGLVYFYGKLNFRPLEFNEYESD